MGLDVVAQWEYQWDPVSVAAAVVVAAGWPTEECKPGRSALQLAYWSLYQTAVNDKTC